MNPPDDKTSKLGADAMNQNLFVFIEVHRRRVVIPVKGSALNFYATFAIDKRALSGDKPA